MDMPALIELMGFVLSSVRARMTMMQQMSADGWGSTADSGGVSVYRRKAVAAMMSSWEGAKRCYSRTLVNEQG